MTGGVSEQAEALREAYRDMRGRFGSQPAAESETRLDASTPLPDGVSPDPGVRCRSNQSGYRLQEPVTWTEPDLYHQDDDRPPATRDFDRVAVSYSVVDHEVLVVGVVDDRPSLQHIVWEGAADDDGDALTQALRTR